MVHSFSKKAPPGRGISDFGKWARPPGLVGEYPPTNRHNSPQKSTIFLLYYKYYKPAIDKIR
jgi:hypothetical protein